MTLRSQGGSRRRADPPHVLGLRNAADITYPNPNVFYELGLALMPPRHYPHPNVHGHERPSIYRSATYPYENTSSGRSSWRNS